MTAQRPLALDEDWFANEVRVPVRITRAEAPRPGLPVLLLHGLGASREVQDKEARSIADAGFTAIAVDAPHHGARRSPRLDAVHAASGGSGYELFLAMVREAVAEIRPLVGCAVARFGEPAGVVGISMGAYTALAAAPDEPRLSVVVSILGSPDWAPRHCEPTPAVRRWLAEAPAHRPDRFPPRALLLGNAGRDAGVPAEATRRFHAELVPGYRHFPERLRHVEYPDSSHMMNEGDWLDLWGTAIGWLERFLSR